MKLRTKNIELLLLISKSLDKKETNFKKTLFNKTLNLLKELEFLYNENLKDYGIQHKIIKFVQNHFQSTDDYYCNNDKKGKFVLLRQIACTLIMDNTQIQIAEIASNMNVTHGTIIYYHKTIDNFMDTNHLFKEMYLGILNKLNLKYTKYVPGERQYSKYRKLHITNNNQ